MSNQPDKVKIPFWRDKRIIPILLQALFVVIVISFGFILVNNAIKGMEAIGIKLGFGFLSSTASFNIGQSLIDYQPTDSYSRALLVGIINTLQLTVIGIILTSILGVFIGIARLSANWLVRSVATVYIEIFRNTPLLVQIIIWALAVPSLLPGVKDSIQLGSVFISNRGIAMPWFETTPATAIWIGFFVVSIVAAILLWKTRLKAQVQKGKRTYPLIWSLGSIVILLAAAWLITGQFPAMMTYPQIGKFNYEGGYIVTKEFAAVLIGLVIYTSTYIAEIVRGGIQSVNKGQVEAARSLGLKGSTIMRLVIFPQAFRVIIPPVTSQYLNLAKNSSLAIAAGYPDLYSVVGTTYNQTGRVIEMVTIMMLVYLSMSLLTSLFMNIFNKKMQLVER